MPDTTELRRQARETYLEIEKNYEKSTEFWRLGHSFDTLIDYTAIDPHVASKVAAMAKDAYVRSRGDWYDDYAWWGIAALRASQRGDLFPGREGEFNKIALKAWDEMDRHAPVLWEKANAVQQKCWPPKWRGGVWNAPFGYTPPPNKPCGNPGGPGGGLLVSIQNTVVNTLYLVLSTRLFLGLRDHAYQAKSTREFDFLRRWFAEQGDDSLLLHAGLGAVLVRERVARYGPPSNARVGGYHAELAWAGDQGLLLGGLVDRMTAVGEAGGEYADDLELALAIINGVIGHMKGAGGGIVPWVPEGSNAPGAPTLYHKHHGDHGDHEDHGDWCDYMTGPAVFFRYMLYAYQNNPHLRARLQKPDVLPFVLASAGPAKLDPHCTTENWTTSGIDSDINPMLTVQTNRLAALVAAIVMQEQA